jgi:pimeloyl-ACP methyl ester carboxylesterase
MAHIRAGDLNLEYYSEGSGQPLLMIRGFGSSAAAWGEPFLEELRAAFTIVRFSNRGTGQSDPGSGDTTVRMMADDAANLMTALGLERSHIFGVSMGGMIAQEFALAYPERVQGLVLGCTTPGGPNAPTANADVIATLTPAPGSTREEQIRAAWPGMVSAEFLAERRDFLEEMLAEALVHPTPLETIVKQMTAVRAFDAYDRVSGIAAPTLVIHGDADELIPYANGKLLHEHIPGSEMPTIPGAGHMFWWEQPSASARAMVEFLSRVPAWK